MANEPLPTETVIRYSTLNLLGYLALFGAFVAGSLHHLWTVRPLGIEAPFFFLICLACPFLIVRQVRCLCHNRPQLAISERGIRLSAAPLDEWQRIQNEEVRQVRSGRGTDTLLYYLAGNEVRALNIRELAISSSQLTRLLQQYRAQSQELRHH